MVPVGTEQVGWTVTLATGGAGATAGVMATTAGRETQDGSEANRTVTL